MLYWTSQQPDPEPPDQPPFENSSDLYSHRAGYALHLHKTGRLAPDIHPDNEAKEKHTLVTVYSGHPCTGQNS